MANYRLKRDATVAARQHTDNFDLRVVSEAKGAQTARKGMGDWLIGDQKGKVFVMPDLQFKADYELVVDESSDEPSDTEPPSDTDPAK
jgi:hypothetical protein